MQSEQGCYGIAHDTRSVLSLDGGSGFGSSSTSFQRFTNIRRKIGDGILYTDSPVYGAIVQVLVKGTYFINYTYNDNANTAFGIYVNPVAADATANPQASGNVNTLVAITNVAVSGNNTSVSIALPLNAGDKIQFAANSASPATGVYNIRATVCRTS